MFSFCFSYVLDKKKNKNVCTKVGGVIIVADMELIAHFIMGWRENVTHLHNWILICNFSETTPALPEDNAFVVVFVVVVGSVVGFYLRVDLILLTFG